MEDIYFLSDNKSRKTIIKITKMILELCTEPVDYAENISGSRSREVEDIYEVVQRSAEELGMDEIRDISEYGALNIPVFSVKKNGVDFHCNYGKGANGLQAKISALMEFIERMSAEKTESTDIYMSYDELKEKTKHAVVNPADMISVYTDYVAETLKINWIPVLNLSKMAIAYAPTIGVLFPYYGDKEMIFNNNTNGIAAGSTFHEAILQGIYEVIERDIISIGIATGKFKKLDLQSIHDDELIKIVGEYQKQNMDIVVNYVENEYDIPCFIACCLDAEGQGVYGGYGCHTNSKIALVRALTELAQSIKSLSYNGDVKQLAKKFDSGDRSMCNHLGEKVLYDEITNRIFQDLDNELKFIIDHLGKANMQVFVANLTMYDANTFVPVVRVIIPRMENWYDTRNRLGRRLYEKIQEN